ncbi:MAG: hypothetical protein F4Y67_04530 [Chloroflexi bacterium]|nr:hypothetical protein [Chloroflexota bacterium]
MNAKVLTAARGRQLIAKELVSKSHGGVKLILAASSAIGWSLKRFAGIESVDDALGGIAFVGPFAVWTG